MLHMYGNLRGLVQWIAVCLLWHVVLPSDVPIIPETPALHAHCTLQQSDTQKC